ncbi:14428_t:CDS:2 [Funneliformis mosseae]|uniref:14428_t:CDS:1 n=1 Tax=Funneliformis mosseae TaxID=27381 RepID=A0A9N9B1M3_FUNMO|nr:14428_t:CDS:2 [Funneliformis mosseae]
MVEVEEPIKEFSSYINESRNSVEMGKKTTSDYGEGIEMNNVGGMDINCSIEVNMEYMPKMVSMTDEPFNVWSSYSNESRNSVEMGKETTSYKK